MHELAVFYCGSNKRLLHLQECIQEECHESTQKRLKMHCTTRWVERQEAVRIFKELLPAIRVSLEQIRIWPHQDCSGKALIFESALDGAFLVVLEILSSVLEVTKPLSVKLQSESQDIHHAMEGVMDAVNVLQQLRDDEPAYDRIFQRAQESHGSEIAKTRMTGSQVHRANNPGSDARQYYRRGMFLPFIDVCLLQLRDGFQARHANAYNLSLLLLAHCDSAEVAAAKEAARLYDQFLPECVDYLEAEFLHWKAYWTRKSADRRPKWVLEALSNASILGTFLSISILLRIFATITVTTATGERSFSALKYVESYLRSTMRKDRLNSLAQLFINKDLMLNHDDVIDEFSKENRRLSFH